MEHWALCHAGCKSASSKVHEQKSFGVEENSWAMNKCSLKEVGRLECKRPGGQAASWWCREEGAPRNPHLGKEPLGGFGEEREPHECPLASRQIIQLTLILSNHGSQDLDLGVFVPHLPNSNRNDQSLV